MATPAQITALIDAVIARANVGSDEAKLAIGSGPDITDPLINDETIDGTFPTGVALGSDVNGSKMVRALLEGIADYFLGGASVPPKTVVYADLSPSEITANFNGTGLGTSANWSGWAICNGNNGTRNLANKFVRAVTGGSGGTGGSDSNSHTHSTPNHQHEVPIGFDENNEFWSDDGSGSPLYGSVVIGSVRRAAPAKAAEAVGAARHALTKSEGGGVTGTPSDTNNMPAYVELTAVMKL